MQTATLRTVKRNSREAREMWDKATRAVSYTLNNYFVGEDITVEAAKSWFDRMVTAKARVRITYDGRAYVIHYHSNLWTELLCPSERKDAAAMLEP